MLPSVVVTDQGKAYIKCLGNPEGPHQLACDLIGTALADWFGLEVYDYSTFRINDSDEIPMKDGQYAIPGECFATRSTDGISWSGDSKDLQGIVNKDDICKMVILDTWVLNHDRCPPVLPLANQGKEQTHVSDVPISRKPNYDNVFISFGTESRSGLRLLAMDFSHAFTSGRPFSSKSFGIGHMQDDRVFGLFQAFKPYVQMTLVEKALEKLSEFDETIISEILEVIPSEWEVSGDMKAMMKNFVCRRAEYVVDTLLSPLHTLCGRQQSF